MDEISAQSSPGVGSFSEILWIDRIDSTNAYLLHAARNGAAHGLVVTADEQTKGRGRRGRTWIAPPGSSLMFSILIRPSATGYFGPVFAYGAALALAARDAINALSGADVKIKYPNDLLLNDRKLAGILVETDISGDVVDAVVLGMGTNTSWSDMPAEIAESATSLNREGFEVDNRTLLLQILKSFDNRLRSLNTAIGEFASQCGTVGQRVKVEADAREITGIATSIAPDGALIVRDDSGVEHRINVGDVIHVR